MHDGCDFTRHRRIRRKSVRSHNEQRILRYLADRVSLSHSDIRGEHYLLDVYIRDETPRKVLDRLQRKGHVRRFWLRGQWNYAIRASARFDPLSPIVDGADLALRGIPLTQKEIEKRERWSAAQPGNLILRQALMDNYDLAVKLDRKGKLRYRNHVLFLIEYKPGHRMLGFRAMRCLSTDQNARAATIIARLWHAQVNANPDDLDVLANAIDFFWYSDSMDAMPLLNAALAIDERPEWLDKIGQERAVTVFAADGTLDAAQASLALAAYERAWELTEEHDQIDAADIAEMAFAAGQSDKARQFAQWTLDNPDDRWGGERSDQTAMHEANIILGRLALLQGDREAAKAYLMAAGDVGSSPPLDVGAFHMSLAQELLEVGEHDVVLRFLGRCSRVWNSSGSRIPEWVHAIERGEMPNFGHNARE